MFLDHAIDNSRSSVEHRTGALRSGIPDFVLGGARLAALTGEELTALSALVSLSRSKMRYDRLERLLQLGLGEARRDVLRAIQARAGPCEDGQKMRIYLTRACWTCPLKDQCTTANERRIRRWKYEHVIEAAQTRLDQNP
jgi:hypothetical protein